MSAQNFRWLHLEPDEPREEKRVFLRLSIHQWWLRHTLTPKAGSESSDGRYIWLFDNWVPMDLAEKLAAALREINT